MTNLRPLIEFVTTVITTGETPGWIHANDRYDLPNEARRLLCYALLTPGTAESVIFYQSEESYKNPGHSFTYLKTIENTLPLPKGAKRSVCLERK